VLGLKNRPITPIEPIQQLEVRDVTNSQLILKVVRIPTKYKKEAYKKELAEW